MQERVMNTGESVRARLLAAIAASDPISGHTHNFYGYPARFSPLFVREVIRQYSRPGEVVFDPFMGGGTTVVEALAQGRKALGVDLNSLAHFVSTVKTTPLSASDVILLREWLADVVVARRRGIAPKSEPVPNLPWRLQRVWADLLEQSSWLPLERQRQFTRCALLKTAQSEIDGKGTIPSSSKTVEKYAAHVQEMMNGLEEFVSSCNDHGVRKDKIRQNRVLLCRSTDGAETDSRLNGFPKPTLVVTSPPYPAVHILYHRWQVLGRRETPAPYWLAAQKDGHGASHYTFGSRSALGLENYFLNAEKTFRSVRQIVASDAVIVQLVAFSDAKAQLPKYLAAMNLAGFVEHCPTGLPVNRRVWRDVPNRKWYCNNGKAQDSAKEVVLFHRPA